MSFTLTKEQLEELGFESYNFDSQYTKYIYLSKEDGWENTIDITYHCVNNFWMIHANGVINSCFYPDSIEDIQTLIRILSPNK